MKKRIAALLALALLLSCLSALAEGAGIKQFGEVEPHRCSVITRPGFGPPESCKAIEEYGLTPEVYEALSADADAGAGAVQNDSGVYRVIVYDPDGNPVEGAVIQLCDDVACAFQATDAEGVATFSVEEQKVYDIHVLVAPEGCAPDDGVYRTLDTFSDVNIFLEKAA